MILIQILKILKPIIEKIVKKQKLLSFFNIYIKKLKLNQAKKMNKKKMPLK